MIKRIEVLTGVVGSGKDYRSELLQRDGYTALAFADGLRSDLWHLIGWAPKNAIEYEQFKVSQFLAFLPAPDMLTGEHVELHEGSFTGRDLLNRYGTDLRRSHDPNVWANRLAFNLGKAAKGGVENVVINDCRFENELCIVAALCSQYKIGLRFTFTNYVNNPRYDATLLYESERMAQGFVSQGFTHLHEEFDESIKLRLERGSYLGLMRSINFEETFRMFNKGLESND